MVGCLRRDEIPVTRSASGWRDPHPHLNAGRLSPMIHRKLQPSGDHILIQYDAMRVGNGETNALRQTKLPSAAKVIAIGPGREGADGNMIPLGLKVGERIFVDRTCGVKIRLKRQSYAVIRKRDLVEMR